MKWFQRFYLDKEKDMIVDLYREEGRGTMHFVLSTPNHGTGNLIRTLAALLFVIFVILLSGALRAAAFGGKERTSGHPRYSAELHRRL